MDHLSNEQHPLHGALFPSPLRDFIARAFRPVPDDESAEGDRAEFERLDVLDGLERRVRPSPYVR